MPPSFPVTIYHNPACGTSRNVLAMLREAGHEPQVVEYLKQPYTREQLQQLLQAMGMRPRELLRAKGELYESLGLADPKWSDDALLDAMVAHPVLVERPIVVTPLGTRLCRPKERVLEILPAARPGAAS
jgi:arsenate reductase